MATLNDGDWADVRRAYEGRDETIVHIARRFAVSPAAISQHAKAHGWQMRGSSGQPADDVEQDNQTRMRRQLIARFYRLITVKLEHMEEDMANSDERTPADNERETRAIGTLVRNFEKVLGLDQEGDGQGRDKQKQDGREYDVDAEALAREFAERVVRLRERKLRDNGVSTGVGE